MHSANMKNVKCYTHPIKQYYGSSLHMKNSSEE